MSLTAWLVIVLTIELLSCDPTTNETKSFAVTLIVESDPGVGLGGARVVVGGEPVGESDSTGRVQTRVFGRVGQRLSIEHECPSGHEAPPEPATLRLREFRAIDASGSPAVEMTLTCRPTKRIAAFIVRAKNGSDLPVLLDGQSVARTNASGVAHLSTSGRPDTEYVIELDTRDHPRLSPQRPKHLFVLPDADEIFILDQAFDVEPRPWRSARRRPRIIKIE
ncbi:MAG: hypothetical protein WBM46_03230 [Polyangiales bacterium]